MPRRRRRGRRRSRGGGYGQKRINIAAAGAVYGYLRKNIDALDKLPTVEAIGRTATDAVILHFAAKYFRSKYLDYAATAVAGHCGVNLGLANFNMADFAAMSGDDAAVVGALDVD